MSPGLAGEMFLIAGNGQFLPPSGALTVEMFDESPRPGFNPQQPPKLGQWRFEKDVLRQLATPHEWGGKIAAVMAFLASEEGRFIKGQVLRVDGGSQCWPS